MTGLHAQNYANGECQEMSADFLNNLVEIIIIKRNRRLFLIYKKSSFETLFSFPSASF